MPKLRRDTRRFKSRALHSLLIAIELFNRPHDIGRTETVLILLQHAFEMLLKAAIFQSRGVICDKKDGIAYGFDRCLGIARSDLGILSEDEALTLSILDGCRDCAMHNLLDLPEEALYLHSQASVTLFDNAIFRVFGDRLADHFPNRVLPISTNPPQDMKVFLDREFTQIRALLATGRRQQAEARGRLRHLIILESNIQGEGRQPKDKEINHIIREVSHGRDLALVFPGVASLRLDTEGHGLTFSVRFTRQLDAVPARLVHEGEEGADKAVLVREVNILDRFSMGSRDLAAKLGMTEPKTRALVHHLMLLLYDYVSS